MLYLTRHQYLTSRKLTHLYLYATYKCQLVPDGRRRMTNNTFTLILKHITKLNLTILMSFNEHFLLLPTHTVGSESLLNITIFLSTLPLKVKCRIFPKNNKTKTKYRLVLKRSCLIQYIDINKGTTY